MLYLLWFGGSLMALYIWSVWVLIVLLLLILLVAQPHFCTSMQDIPTTTTQYFSQLNKEREQDADHQEKQAGEEGQNPCPLTVDCPGHKLSSSLDIMLMAIAATGHSSKLGLRSAHILWI